MEPPSTADKSQGNLAYDTLLAALQTGYFQPGDRLRESALADQLNLSRTPIREALRRLEVEGIVLHEPRLGAVIRTLTHAEVVELYEMRVVLERTAAELAAKHGVAAQIDTLEDLNTQLQGAIDAPQQAAAINQKFHHAIYLATRNRFLMDSARALNNALMLLGPTTLADPERIKTVCAQHQQIITALRAGDVAAAGAAAEAHLQTSLRHRLKVMTR